MRGYLGLRELGLPSYEPVLVQIEIYRLVAFPPLAHIHVGLESILLLVGLVDNAYEKVKSIILALALS
jgi:hypothetical protein